MERNTMRAEFVTADSRVFQGWVRLEGLVDEYVPAMMEEDEFRRFVAEGTHGHDFSIIEGGGEVRCFPYGAENLPPEVWTRSYLEEAGEQVWTVTGFAWATLRLISELDLQQMKEEAAQLVELHAAALDHRGRP